MAKIIDAITAKGIASPYGNIDEAYFDDNIEYWQEFILKPVLTEAVYNDLIAEVTTPPISAKYQTLIDNYIQYALSYGVAFLTLKKDVMKQFSNQGVMINRTDNSQAESNKMVLKEYKEREFNYLYELGCYIIDNREDYPLLDYTKVCLYPDFRTFVTI
jgi:hypothetical protein